MAETQLPLEAPEPATPSDSGSLADHEAQFGDSRRDGSPDRATTESSTPPAETAEPEPAAESTDSAEVEDRDEKGRFLPKKTRHTASKDLANREDVPRIRTLSAQLQAARAELDALKARPQGTPISAPTSLPSAPPVAAPPKPKPTPDQYQAWDEYQSDLIQWNVDQALAKVEQQRAEQERQRTAAAETQRLISSWEEKKAAAMAKYPDFESVALQSPTRIPQGSLIDAWVLENQQGADLLLRLQQQPQAVEALLQQPLLTQAESLALFAILHKSPEELRALAQQPLFQHPDVAALLQQRLNGAITRSATVATGSAPAPPSPLLPRPPNPVRTGPMKAGDEPPADGASLADHERYFPLRRPRG